MTLPRPSETLTAIVGSVVGAILVIIGSATNLKVSTEVSGAIVTLVSWTAVAVTWYIARRQRAGQLVSAEDGTVKG